MTEVPPIGGPAKKFRKPSTDGPAVSLVFQAFETETLQQPPSRVEPSSHLLNLGWPRDRSDPWNAADVTFWDIRLGPTHFPPRGVQPLCR